MKTIKHTKLNKLDAREILNAAILDVGKDAITVDTNPGANYFMWDLEGISYILGFLSPSKGKARGYYYLNAY